MSYRVRIKIRIGSSISSTSIIIDAENATIAKALAEELYGKNSVLSVKQEAK